MGSKQIGFSKGCQHGEERFGAAHFVAKKFKGMRQGVANGKAECAQTKRVQKDRHLMAHSLAAVLQISVIKSEARIDEGFSPRHSGSRFRSGVKNIRTSAQSDLPTNQNRRPPGHLLPAQNK